MKTAILVLFFLVSVAQSAPIRDEELSQKYESLILDGEDHDNIRDQMTQEGVTPEDLELELEDEE